MRPALIALAVASLALLSGSQPADAADPWTNEQYQLGGGNNSHQANQYGATIGSGAASATQAPSPLDRAQNAVVGTAGTLRDGVEAGIRQANQAGGQVVSGTTNAGRDLSQQFQNATGLGSQSQSPSAATWPAPPPSVAASSGTVPSNATSSRTATSAGSSGWTSIHAEMAPPTLLAPPLVPLNNSTVGTSSSTSGAGPSFPSAPPFIGSSNGANQRDQFHSLLADPTTTSRQSPATSTNTGQSAAKAPDWSSGWGTSATNQATIGRPSDSTSGRSNSDLSPNTSAALPRVGPEIPRQSAGSFATDADPWNRPMSATQPSNTASRSISNPTIADDRYNPAPASTQNGSSIWAGLPAQSTASSTSAPLGNFNSQPGLTNQPSTSFGNFPNQPSAGQIGLGQPGINPSTTGQTVAGQPLLGQQGGNVSTLGFGNQNAIMGQQPMNADQLPWVPLLVVSLAFAGSFGANIYLGWSYADARHRYHSLVRRSTESFHKATGIAA
jgi:hypothetical protein